MPDDLILLHAPSVYDFREKVILYGPVSEHIPPSPVFELYPLGLTSIADYLERAGYRVRIVNLAVRMMQDWKFNVKAFIQRLKAPVFGIDLHWLLHCHGAIEVARLVKRCHPDAKVIFGGLSSSYFYRQLMEYPEIDYVMRGDTTEEPLRQLMDCVRTGAEPSAVPNLVWRNGGGQVVENPFSHVPADLDGVMVGHYLNMVRQVVRYRDLRSITPFSNWREYPITAVLICKGCGENCVICGGSEAAFRRCYRRNGPVFRSSDAVVREVRQIARLSTGPIFILGDLQQAGDDYAYEVLRRLRAARVKNQFIFEFFNPAPTELIKRIGQACPDFCLEMSAESHDPTVRRASGRHYSNEELERTIEDAFAAGCGRFDLFFMIGLPQQTAPSVAETIDYCEYLLQKHNGDKRLGLFIAPMSPFLDPGSLGYEEPERYGYKVLFRTLEEHRQALLSPSWKDSLNYETEWLSRDQIAESAYDAILRLTRLKLQYGNIAPALARAGEQRIMEAREMMHRLDDLKARGELAEKLPYLKAEIDRINAYPVVDKKQLELPVGWIKLKPWRALWALLTGR